MNIINRQSILKSLYWKLLERGGSQLVGFIVTVILARILTPADYGTIAVVNIFLSITTVLVQGGMNTALIQKKQIDELDISTVFYLSLFVFSLIYVVLYLCSPSIAAFFNIQEIENILPVLALSLLFGVFNSIQFAFLSREMRFKDIFISTLISVVISGVVGILMAIYDYGVWALVGQQFVSQIVQAAVLGHITKWYPRLLFSWKRLIGILSFSINILLTNLLTSVFMELRSLAIGKVYTPSQLSFFEKGRYVPKLVMTNINTSLLSVLFPALSSIQDDKLRMKQMLRRCVKTSAYIITPLMILLVVIAEPFVSLILSDKWLPAVPYMQIFAITYLLTPLHHCNLEVIKAMGKSGIILKLDILKKIVEILSLVLTIKYGPLMIAAGALFSSIISLFINLYPNKTIINYSFSEQFRDVLPAWGLTALITLLIYPLSCAEIASLYKILLETLIFASLYIMGSYIFKMESFFYVIKLFKHENRNSNNLV